MPTTRLRAHRRARGLRQSDLARLLSIDQTTVSLWERGAARPRRQSCQALEAIFAPLSAEQLLAQERVGAENSTESSTPGEVTGEPTKVSSDV